MNRYIFKSNRQMVHDRPLRAFATGLLPLSADIQDAQAGRQSREDHDGISRRRSWAGAVRFF